MCIGKFSLKFGMMLSTVCFLSPAWAVELPGIIQVTGIGSPSGIVDIYGAGFGTKAHAAPLKWDNFNNAILGQLLVDHDSYWASGTGNHITISKDNPRIGNNIKAVLKASDPGDLASMVWHDKVGFADTGKIYLNYWVRTDFGTAKTAGYFQVKSVEIAVGENQWGNGNQTMPMLSINHFAYPGTPWYTQCLLGNYRSQISVKGNLTPGSNVITNVDYSGQKIVVGMTVSGTGIPNGTTVAAFTSTTITLSKAATATTSNSSVTIYAPADPTIYFPNNTFDRSSPSWQNVVIQAYMGNPGVANGSKWYWASVPNFSAPYARVGANNRPILDAVAQKLNSIKIGWYRSGYVPGKIAAGTSVVQYDDIYIDNSWARVEIGNQPTYDSCTHREIQIPVTWSSDHIQVKFNKGSFPGHQTVYVFVIDGNGRQVGSGFPVYIGS